MRVTGGAWFGFGTDSDLALETTLITNNRAACCFASGYGAQLLSNATLTCADTDSGENRGDCCYNNQYSNGTNCVTCQQGTNCSVVGTSLATQLLVKGYWRASTTSTDVRPCWFSKACTGNSSTTTAAAAGMPSDCATTISTDDSAFRSDKSSSTINSADIVDGVGCDDNTMSSLIGAIDPQLDDTTYCAQGYKGACKYHCQFIILYVGTVLHAAYTLRNMCRVYLILSRYYTTLHYNTIDIHRLCSMC
jgi:hypothetical protein